MSLHRRHLDVEPDSEPFSSLDVYDEHPQNLRYETPQTLVGTPAEDSKVEDKYDFSAYAYTEEESRAVVRKLDWHILPFIFFGYLFNALDRNNISNAKSGGMTEDLRFPQDGYRTLLCIFFIPFTIGVVPMVMLTRRVGPRYTIPGYMLGWGIMAVLGAACTNFGGAVAVRFVQGIFQAGFSPSLIYYLTTFYSRGELAKRIGVFYSTNALSGAFGGLIAYGVFQLDSKLKGWQILLLIEGALTVGWAVLTAFMLPWSSSTAAFLNPREKEVARLRVLKDGSGTVDAKFDVNAFFAPLRDWKLYTYAIIGLLYGIATSVADSFMTQIVSRFGYSVVKTNLFTVAPFAFGTLMMITTAWSSDYFRERGFHLASAISLAFIGCIILVSVPVSNHAVGYFAVFLITGGAQTPSVIFHSWHPSNEANEDARAFKVGVLTFVANSGGFVSANIFLDKWSPAYSIPLIIVAATQGLAISIIVAFRMWMQYDNGKRNTAQSVNWTSKDIPTEALKAGPRNPSFRHFV
ncbi:uncharacterized protein L199_006200 [Kwoniella botswanensis]|uniref:uncharacterized protein n=1 Tax=Kwoniella botswanensis TaxID=1268659 RepID=UPI00315CBFA5